MQWLFFCKQLLNKGSNSEIHGFRDSVSVCNLHDCYYDTQKFRATFHSNPRFTKRLQCEDVTKPLQNFLQLIYTVYTYLNCIIYQLFCCSQIA